MTALLTGAPPVFDIVGLVVAVCAPVAAVAYVQSPPAVDPRFENYHRLIGAISSVALAAYIAHFITWGTGGLANLLAFLLGVNDRTWIWTHTWTVWLTLAACAALVGHGFTMFALSITRPIGNRLGLPVGRYVVAGTIFAAMWYFDIGFPLSKTDALFWMLAYCGNFFLHALWLVGMTEGAAALLLLLKPNFSAWRRIERERERHSFTLRPGED